MNNVTQEALKTLIEVSTSVEIADEIINRYYKTIPEKVSFLKENFPVTIYNEPDEDTYQAMLSNIIDEKWKPA